MHSLSHLLSERRYSSCSSSCTMQHQAKKKTNDILIFNNSDTHVNRKQNARTCVLRYQLKWLQIPGISSLDVLSCSKFVFLALPCDKWWQISLLQTFCFFFPCRVNRMTKKSLIIIIIGFNSGHPHSGSYRPLYPDRIGIWKVLVFAERGKPEYPEKNLS